MAIRVELEMLAVLLLLTPIVTDGLVMDKCQLDGQLLSVLPPDVPDRDIQAAKLVCHAEQTSQFDTSLVKQVTGQELPGNRKRRAVAQKKVTPKPVKVNNATPKPSAVDNKPPPKPSAVDNKPPPKPSAVDNKSPPKPNAVDNKSPPKPSAVDNKSPPKPNAADNKSPPKPNAVNTKPLPPKIGQPTIPPPPQNTQNPNPQIATEPPQPQNPVIIDQSSEVKPQNSVPLPSPPEFTLYGVFQLADRVACASDKPSLNVCNLDCKKLIDDDITDDVQCVLTILNTKPNPDVQDEASQLIKTLSDRLMNSCPNTDFTQYLAGCNMQ
ncbi:vegetative cell wall protein gp1-like [Silurus asotus]|uniref:lysozyme n=1 Tax=Silurus asotus TaxID=30991 RepID=A0AAD5AZM6_SILAS|nr:vegetative cell wall protein gp1-like [Silurus asotus]